MDRNRDYPVAFHPVAFLALGAPLDPRSQEQKRGVPDNHRPHAAAVSAAEPVIIAAPESTLLSEASYVDVGTVPVTQFPAVDHYEAISALEDCRWRRDGDRVEAGTWSEALVA